MLKKLKQEIRKYRKDEQAKLRKYRKAFDSDPSQPSGGDLDLAIQTTEATIEAFDTVLKLTVTLRPKKKAKKELRGLPNLL